MDPLGLQVKRCARKLGNRNKPSVPPRGNPFRHDYLVINDEVRSFQSGQDHWWDILGSQGYIDRNENVDNSQCETIYEGDEHDQAVMDAIDEIGAPYYNIYSYPGTKPYRVFGARNCQTWVDDVLKKAEEIYQSQQQKKQD